MKYVRIRNPVRHGKKKYKEERGEDRDVLGS